VSKPLPRLPAFAGQAPDGALGVVLDPSRFDRLPYVVQQCDPGLIQALVAQSLVSGQRNQFIAVVSQNHGWIDRTCTC